MYADNISLYLCFLSVPFQNPLINHHSAAPVAFHKILEPGRKAWASDQSCWSQE